MRTAILAVALFLTTSPLFAQVDDEQVERRKARTPTSGKIRTVSVGEVAFAEFDQTEYLWAELKSDIVAPGLPLPWPPDSPRSSRAARMTAARATMYGSPGMLRCPIDHLQLIGLEA